MKITCDLSLKEARFLIHAMETQIWLWERQAAWDDDGTILNDAELMKITLATLRASVADYEKGLTS